MPGHPDSSDSVAAPGAGNGRWRLWLWGGVGLLVLLVAVVWLALPWATCRWLRSQAPWDTGAVVITGAAWGGTPPPAMVVGVCDRATLLAIWRGSSGKSLPAALLANHQHAWGTFSAAPEITWRVDLDDLVAEPRITAAIPQALAEKLLAASLKADAPQLSRVHLTTVALTGTPQADGVATWTLALAGDAVVTINQQALPLRLTALAGGRPGLAAWGPCREDVVRVRPARIAA